MSGIRVDQNDAFAVIEVVGDFSGAKVDRFRSVVEPLASQPGSSVAVELAGVGLMSSEALSAMMNAVARARLVGSRVVLVAPSVFVTGILRVTCLDRWFDVFADLPSARKELLGGG